jgi:hypothetical protein
MASRSGKNWQKAERLIPVPCISSSTVGWRNVLVLSARWGSLEDLLARLVAAAPVGRTSGRRGM